MPFEIGVHKGVGRLHIAADSLDRAPRVAARPYVRQFGAEMSEMCD